jgi:hypothetical protein
MEFCTQSDGWRIAYGIAYHHFLRDIQQKTECEFIGWRNQRINENNEKKQNIPLWITRFRIFLFDGNRFGMSA